MTKAIGEEGLTDKEWAAYWEGQYHDVKVELGTTLSDLAALKQEANMLIEGLFNCQVKMDAAEAIKREWRPVMQTGEAIAIDAIPVRAARTQLLAVFSVLSTAARSAIDKENE